MPVIRIKRGTTTQWSNSLTPLTGGELGYDITSKVIKIGDGTTLWNDLLPLNKFEIDEISQDAIYSALTNFVSVGNNITVEYNDVDNYMILDVGPNVVLTSTLEQSVSDRIAELNTDNLNEGLANLYWTESRTKEAAAELLVNANLNNLTITGNGSGLTITAQNGVAGSTTDNLLEGTTNLYFTNQRALDATVLAYDAIGAATTAQSNAIASANEYTDLAVSGLGNSIEDSYVPQSDVGALDGVAQLVGGYVPDSQISPSIARDSELFSGSYNDLSDKPNIALGAVQWTANHTLLPGGENTRYLIGDIVYDGGKIYVANYENESIPTSSTLYWSEIGSGKRLNIDGRDIPNITYSQLSGKPTIPDLAGYATETYVNTAVSNLVDTAPETLNTLNELAAAINDDASYASTITTALGTKAPLDSPTFTGTVSGISSSMVGLGNVDNTSDANKPISTATQTALNSKLDSSGFTYASITIPVYSTIAELPSAASNHGRWAHVHGEGAMFFAHGGVWYRALSETNLYVNTNAQSSSYTLATTDLDKLIEMSGGGTLTISDSASFPVGFTCDVLQTGSSQVTIAGSGFTPNATPGLKLRTQWSSATLIKRALNSWVVLGDLSA